MLVNLTPTTAARPAPAALPANHAHKGIAPALWTQYEQIKAGLRPAQQPRPAWDVQLLRRAGFVDIRVDNSIWRRIYARQDEFYNPTPIFALSARA